MPSTPISPDCGRSRSAIERKVVVLPQPLGPSSVKNSPLGTSKQTFCAALTAWPSSLVYSVYSASTLSTAGSLLILDAEFPADVLRQHHQDEQHQDEQNAERRELHVLAVLPQFPDHNRHHLGARAVEQDRARQLADRHDHDVDPARDQARLEQRQDDAVEGRPP